MQWARYQHTNEDMDTLIEAGNTNILISIILAFTYGGRRPLLWFTIICHGLVVECVCYAMADIDNFWHSLSPIMFFGQRLPLYVIVLCMYLYIVSLILNSHNVL